MSNIVLKRLFALTLGIALLASFGAVMLTQPTQTADAQAACGLLWDAKYYNDREFGTQDGSLIWVECLPPSITGGLSTTFDSAAVPDTNFSAEFERSVTFGNGTYEFVATFEDGVRVYVGTELVIDEWTLYPGPRTVTAQVYIGGVPQSVKIEFFNGNGGNARLDVSWLQISSGGNTPVPGVGSGGGGGSSGTSSTPVPVCDDTVSSTSPWSSVYYNSTDFTGTAYTLESSFDDGKPLSRDYGDVSPGLGLTNDAWSAIFTRSVEFPITSTVEFSLTVDDIATVYLDGEAIIATHTYFTGQTYTATLEVPEGSHTIEVKYTEFVGDDYVNLTWTNADNGGGGSCANVAGAGGGSVSSPTGVVATVTAGAGLNYRDCPDLTCTKLGKIDNGTSWAVLGRNDDATWANLDVNGVSVWALAEWLSFSGGDFPAVPVTWDNGFDPELPAGIPIRAVGNVKLRECPSFRCARITFVPWGTQVVTTGINSNGYWLKVYYNDPELGVVTGWSYALWYYNNDFTLPLPELPVIAE